MEQSRKGLAWADGVPSESGGPRTAGPLDRLNAATPCADLASIVQFFYRNRTDRGGRPNVPIVIMLKITFMQRWFGLSDPAMEEALLDRLRLRRHLGWGMDDGTVDPATIAQFRKLLHEQGLAAELFDRVNAHLQPQGLIVKEGTAVDATIREAPAGRPRKHDGLASSKDRAASFTTKHGRTYHGYKAQPATDADALITGYRVDTAKVHDIQHFDALTEDEQDVTGADWACRDKTGQQALETRGVFYGVMHRRVRGQASWSNQQKRHNRWCARFRGICEMPFAWLRRAGRERTRYRGSRKTATGLGWWAASRNLWRSLSPEPA